MIFAARALVPEPLAGFHQLSLPFRRLICHTALCDAEHTGWWCVALVPALWNQGLPPLCRNASLPAQTLVRMSPESAYGAALGDLPAPRWCPVTAGQR
jgi:hypothetical protein